MYLKNINHCKLFRRTINIDMTTTTQQSFKGKTGGYRPGAGRPKGSKTSVTITALLSEIETKTGGGTYEEILVADFLQARRDNDTATVLKYHNLILNKVMNSLARIELEDNSNSIEAKQLAFAAALSKLTDKN